MAKRPLTKDTNESMQADKKFVGIALIESSLVLKRYLVHSPSPISSTSCWTTGLSASPLSPRSFMFWDRRSISSRAEPSREAVSESSPGFNRPQKPVEFVLVGVLPLAFASDPERLELPLHPPGPLDLPILLATLGRTRFG